MSAQLLAGLLLLLPPARGEADGLLLLGGEAGGREAATRCVRRVVMEERREPQEVVTCTSSLRRSCHTTYVTEYGSHQEEECRDGYVKDCFISFSPSLATQPVHVCTESLEKNCSIEAAPVCQAVRVSSCSTVQERRTVQEQRPLCRLEREQVACGGEEEGSACTVGVTRCELVRANVTRSSPRTQCARLPVRVCGPGPCPLVRGKLRCRRETRGILSQVPVEECSLRVRPDCRTVTKLVPRLAARQECQEVPQEVCVRGEVPGQTKSRPTVRLWCFTPRFPRNGRVTPRSPTSPPPSTSTAGPAYGIEGPIVPHPPDPL